MGLDGRCALCLRWNALPVLPAATLGTFATPHLLHSTRNAPHLNLPPPGCLRSSSHPAEAAVLLHAVVRAALPAGHVPVAGQGSPGHACESLVYWHIH